MPLVSTQGFFCNFVIEVVAKWAELMAPGRVDVGSDEDEEVRYQVNLRGESKGPEHELCLC